MNLRLVLTAVLSLTMFVVGGFFFYKGHSNQVTTKAAALDTYTTDWKASKIFAINTDNLKIKYGNGSSRKWLAIGISDWAVTGSTETGTYFSENWTAPDPICYSNMAACQPGGSQAGSYLYDLQSENKMDMFKNMTISRLLPTDPLLYDTSKVNFRFQGPGAVGETSSGANIEGFYTTGPYAWFAGTIGEGGSREYSTASGIMMPLKWHVVGKICDSSDCTP